MSRHLFEQFNGKTVLLTGHTGFKGSWLTLWLKHLGARVVGYAWEPPTDPSHYVVADIAGIIDRSVIADIRDLERFRDLYEAEQPDVVIHMAAQTIVKVGYESPHETFSINVMGTVNVLESIRLGKRPTAVLVVSSDKCYQNLGQVWGYRESDAMGTYCPYGGSKGAAELAIRAYQHSFFPIDRLNEHGVWLASARAGNVLGGGDWTDSALIVDTVKALMSNASVYLRNPCAVRPWQHVLQCLSGYLVLTARLIEKKHPSVCSGWNIGPKPGGELTVQEIVDRFIHYWGSGDYLCNRQAGDQPEAAVLRLSIDKALSELCWRPILDIDQTLEMTAKWYRAFAEKSESMQKISMSQIEAFESDFFHATSETSMPRQSLLYAR